MLGSFVLFCSEEAYIDEAFIMLPTAVCFFYVNLYWIQSIFKQHPWRYLFAISVWLMLMVGVGTFVFYLFLESGYQSSVEEVVVFFDYSLFLHFILLGISSSLGISKIAERERQEKEKIEALQKDNRLKYLDNQLNAHFLYNALNSIYAAAILEDAPNTTEAILQLSEMLRYPMQQGRKRRVALTEEIAFIEKYIGFQQIRLGQNYPISFHKKGNLDSFSIAPLTLISLVENAFKYGVSIKTPSPISFEVTTNATSIIFTTRNQLINHQKTASHNIGIQNLKDRLNILYGENFSLDIEKSKQFFLVSVQLFGL